MRSICFNETYASGINNRILKFNNYILLSVCFHLLFFGIMGSAYSNGHERERIFNVDLVEIEPLKSPEIKRSKPVLKKRQPAVRKRRPMAKRLPPDTIWNEIPSSKDTISPPAGKSPRNGPLADRGIETAEENRTDRSFLFDREVINKYASNIPRSEKGISFDTSEFKHRGYLQRLKEKIEGIWEYPRDAIRKGLSGDLFIIFTINRKGELGEVEVVRTSGYRSLDRAAVKALEDAAPFWPLPDDWPDEQLQMRWMFIYIAGRPFVM